MNVFHSIFNTCTNMLFYATAYTLNVLLSIIVKVTFKDARLGTYLNYRNNRIIYTLEDGAYTFTTPIIREGSLKKISLQVTRNLESIIKISDLKLIIHKINNTDSGGYPDDCWRTDYYNLNNDLIQLGEIKKKIYNTHIIINSLELFYEKTDFKVFISNISVQRRRGSDDIIVRFNRMKLYYKELFIGSINKNKIIIKTNEEGILRKYINIDNININIFTKILYNNFIERIREIYTDCVTEGSELLPHCCINTVRVNTYLLNYIQLNCKNIVVSNDILKIGHILGKIWKKDIIWINDLDIHIRGSHHPEIKHLRIRLFTSTSDKLYKSFIILRKKFYPIHGRHQKNTRDPQLPCYSIITTYITERQKKPLPKNIYRNEKISSNEKNIYNTYVQDLLDIVMDYKLFIKSIQLDLSDDGGKIVADDVSIKTDGTYNYLYITNWVFYKHKIKYISKYNVGSSDQCIFKFNNDEMDITPYKLLIFLDTKQYSYSFNIIKDNITRLTQLFSSNFYYYNRGYIFERFYMRSFYAEFSYKKRHLKLGKLIEGHKIQLLNCINVNKLDLILKEVHTVYPVNWDEVVKKIINVYANSIYEYNMDSIIKKIAGSKTVYVMNLKENFKSLKKKLKNFK